MKLPSKYDHLRIHLTHTFFTTLLVSATHMILTTGHGSHVLTILCAKSPRNKMANILILPPCSILVGYIQSPLLHNSVTKNGETIQIV